MEWIEENISPWSSHVCLGSLGAKKLNEFEVDVNFDMEAGHNHIEAAC